MCKMFDFNSFLRAFLPSEKGYFCGSASEETQLFNLNQSKNRGGSIMSVYLCVILNWIMATIPLEGSQENPPK